MSIDYDKMNREFPKQKAALTRAKKKGYEAVVETTTKTVAQWEETGAWPDDWAIWQRALDDAHSEARHLYVQGKLDEVPQPVDMDDIQGRVRLAAVSEPVQFKLRIGDTVSTVGKHEPPYDGTVVDVVDPHSDPQYVRVYWRYPLGKVADYHATELRTR